jgi:hypothetical protein
MGTYTPTVGDFITYENPSYVDWESPTYRVIGVIDKYLSAKGIVRAPAVQAVNVDRILTGPVWAGTPDERPLTFTDVYKVIPLTYGVAPAPLPPTPRQVAAVDAFLTTT